MTVPSLSRRLALAAPVACLAFAAAAVGQQSPTKPPLLRGDGIAPDVLRVPVDLSTLRLPVRTGPSPAGVATSPGAGLQGPGLQAPPNAQAAPPVPQGPAGELVWEEGGDVHQFGALVSGSQISHTFHLTTAGEHPLVIYSTKSSCGCTVSSTVLVGADGARTPYVFGDEIAPGTKLELTVDLDTNGKSGKLHSQITVQCNDARRAVPLRLEADVTPFFELSPNAYLNFGRVFANEQAEGRLTVTSPVADRFALTVRTEGMPEYVAVELVPQDLDAEGRAASWEVLGRILPGAPESPSNHWPVRLESDVPLEGAAPLPDGTVRTQGATVYLVAEVAGLVSARPNYVSFGLVRAGQRMERTVRIEIADEEFVPGDMPVRIVSRNPAEQALFDQAISTELETIEEGKVYELRVALDGLPQDYNQPFGGHLEVQVGHPTKESLAIAFTGVARAAAAQPQPPRPVPEPNVPTGGGPTDGGR